ncbi:uncharacterized protein LOC128551949 [Mercenaria mercenaria]|uniref:uncharacterized protein LOC128551949 n=1 Tax=Mercenaria mercenaria TaxID=6596 RepID=UPI00234EFC88|nr:uncharacterized protein LOC128551949 [Mercenaria mercenaria]
MMEADIVTVKVHYSYHGEPRCSPFPTALKDLVNLGRCGFVALIKQNVQYIRRYDSVRLSYFDEDKVWVDLTDESFMDFLKTTTCTGGTDQPKLNVKVFDGASPATPVAKRQKRIETDGYSRRKLEEVFNNSNLTETRSGTPEFTYKSPVAIDIALKEEELELKRCELRSLETAYDEKCEMYNLNIIKDKSKKRCTKCHLRTNHTQRSCDLGQCEDVRQCGELDFHHEEKNYH